MFDPVFKVFAFMHGFSPLFMKRFFKLVPVAFCLPTLILCGCSGNPAFENKYAAEPDYVNMSESPDFFLARLRPESQELNTWKELGPSLRKSLLYVNSKRLGQMALVRPGLSVTWGELAHTLRRLMDLLPQLDREPGLLASKFTWVPIEGGIKYSGYYEPRVRASRTKKAGYEHPIYMPPPDLQKFRAKGRPYYDRKSIETQKILANRSLELAWAADPVDVFYLEIQGSGKLVFDDGSEAYINYAGQNGHKYKSSGRIMREKGLLERGDIFEQREWFRNNPDRVQEILHENPSFVFFKFGGRGPTGAMGHTVDDWISLATDRNFIPLGAIVAYGVNIPDEKYGKLPLRGIGLAHDVGGAIKRNRIDIFCGGDERANYVASFLDAPGPAWILLAKRN